MSTSDLRARIADEKRVPLIPLIHVHELTAEGTVMQDQNVKVTATVVDHPPMVPAFAYRFDAPDRSIVISGDTSRSENVVKLAHGADKRVYSAVPIQMGWLILISEPGRRRLRFLPEIPTRIGPETL